MCCLNHLMQTRCKKHIDFGKKKYFHQINDENIVMKYVKMMNLLKKNRKIYNHNKLYYKYYIITNIKYIIIKNMKYENE